jgi:hypothetical protein
VDAYEPIFNRNAACQDEAADASRGDWLAAVVPAQASYTREVTTASATAARARLGTRVDRAGVDRCGGGGISPAPRSTAAADGVDGFGAAP